MHIIRKPIMVNGKRVGANKAMQAIDSLARDGISQHYECDCELCEIWQAVLNTGIPEAYPEQQHTNS